MYKVIVASIPRTGSTLLARAIEGLERKGSWEQQNANKVYKTHYPETDVNICDKAIFLFGDVIKSVISYRQNRWDIQSMRNCKCYKDLKDIDLYKRDDCNFEKIFDTWTNPIKHRVLAVRYEEMWKYQDRMKDFVGWDFTLPTKRTRLTNYADVRNVDLHNIKKTYNSLINKVCNISNIKEIA